VIEGPDLGVDLALPGLEVGLLLARAVVDLHLEPDGAAVA
jgi:hypothetical protein